MIVSIVRFEPEGVSPEEIKSRIALSAGRFTALPGLIRRISCYNAPQNRCNIISLWESQDAANRSFADPVAIKNFREEFHCLAEFDHYNVVTVVDGPASQDLRMTQDARGRKRMIVTIVRYRPEGRSPAELAEIFERSIPSFSAMPGLIRKYYCYDEPVNQGVSIYLWESREAAEKCFGSPEIIQRFRTSFNCLPEINYHDVALVMDGPGAKSDRA